MSFSARNLSVRYPRSETFALADISIDMAPASVCAIIGPNGSGKSTLIRALLGAIEPVSGSVTYEDRSVADWPRRKLALHVAAVSQNEEMAFSVTTRQLVAMGRYAHLSAFGAEKEKDRKAIEQAMLRCDVAQFAQRPVHTLSGGERQRARIARALAQESRALVLDEPGTALDIAHEMTVFELLRRLACDEGYAVIVATHHLNLAARYADTLLILDAGRIAAFGNPVSVMQRRALEDIYSWPLIVHSHPGPGFDTGAPQIAPLSRNPTDNP